ncbi:MAG: thioredoxin [Rubripirellula sp.]
MSDKVLQLTDDTFASEVLQNDQPVLVDVWAPWCGPCRALSPLIEELADEHQATATVGKLNVDDNPNTAATYGINAIPTVLVFRNGELVEQLAGLQPKSVYTEALNRAA